MRTFFRWLFFVLGMVFSFVNSPLILGVLIQVFSRESTSIERGVFIGEMIAYVGLPTFFFVGFYLFRKKKEPL